MYDEGNDTMSRIFRICARLNFSAEEWKTLEDFGIEGHIIMLRQIISDRVGQDYNQIVSGPRGYCPACGRRE